LAYDLAIGAGDSVDDVVFYQYLCRVADWRLDWNATRAKGRAQVESDTELDLPDEDVRALYRAEEAGNRKLIDSTEIYRRSGAIPSIVGNTLPSLVATQTINDRYYDRPVCFGGPI
ncbi:effector protein Tle3 domain-containing protein, partial [Pseudomonas aeruginosa]